MTAPISYGYLRPDRKRLNPGPWTVVTADDVVHEDPEIVPDWDYFTDLRVVRSLKIDLPGLLSDCNLDGGSVVGAVIAWQSSWTGLRGASAMKPLVNGENVLELPLSGESLGGRLTLSLRVVLGHANGGAPLAPNRPGSLLWSDMARVALEGSGSRFPVVPVAFEESGLAGGRTGAWYLNIEMLDLTASGSGSLRLYLNPSHPAIKEMLDQPETDASRQLAEFIHYDVARQLVVQALLSDELDDQIAYESDSLGDMLIALLARLFPDRDLRTLQGDYRTTPGELEAEIQGRLGLKLS